MFHKLRKPSLFPDGRRTALFGEVEATLARMHRIAPDKRTAFQSRLKTFHRIGLPIDFESSQGKAAQYRAGEIVEMAIILELTQLGIAPERVRTVMGINASEIARAMRMAARELRTLSVADWNSADEKLTSMFLFFDPAGLLALMEEEEDEGDWASATFHCGGEGILKEKLPFLWGEIRRLAIINVTATIHAILTVKSPEVRDLLLDDLEKWKDHDIIEACARKALGVSHSGYVETVTEEQVREVLKGTDLLGLSPEFATTLAYWHISGNYED